MTEKVAYPSTPLIHRPLTAARNIRIEKWNARFAIEIPVLQNETADRSAKHPLLSRDGCFVHEHVSRISDPISDAVFQARQAVLRTIPASQMRKPKYEDRIGGFSYFGFRT
jgi:hypothetical protein